MKPLILTLTFIALLSAIPAESDAQLFRRGVFRQQFFQPRYSQCQQDRSHNCPSCGTYQVVIAGYNSNGTHNHRCNRCGTVWSH